MTAREAKMVQELSQIHFRDEAAKKDWEKIIIAYADRELGFAIISFAYRWAKAIENELAQNKKLEDVARSTCTEADIEGVTGDMYRSAIRLLDSYWKYGRQLLEWNNSWIEKDEPW